MRRCVVNNFRDRNYQSGAALLIGMVMLVIMTLLALSALQFGRGGLTIVGNMQNQNEAVTAADAAIEEAVSTTRIFSAPNAIFLNPCKGQNTKCVDVTGDGKVDVVVSLAPTPSCIAAQTIKNASLDLSNQNDAGCAVGVSQNLGVLGASSGNSLCANSLWDVNAVAVDQNTLAQATVTEGLKIRVSTDNVSASCP